MKADKDRALARALGRLPPQQKAQFILLAKTTLERARSAKAPSQEEYEALANVAAAAHQLTQALKYVQRFRKADAYLHNAWREVAARTADGLPELPENLGAALERLQEAARLWLPGDNPRHRPADFSTRAPAILLLAEHFRDVFGAAPTYGAGSPFVKFCRAAFPEYGFGAPSPGKLRDPFNRYGKPQK